MANDYYKLLIWNGTVGFREAPTHPTLALAFAPFKKAGLIDEQGNPICDLDIMLNALQTRLNK